MKKFWATVGSFLLPFILIWTAFICTAFSFNPHNVFLSGEFWGFSAMYWLIWICVAPAMINEIYQRKSY
jgi:hypothetical protein